MRVQKVRDDSGLHFLLLDGEGLEVAAVSSFYEHLILTGDTSQDENPLRKVPDFAAARVTPRYVPFLHLTTRQRPFRRVVRVRTAQRLPRPLTDEQVSGTLRLLRAAA